MKLVNHKLRISTIWYFKILSNSKLSFHFSFSFFFCPSMGINSKDKRDVYYKMSKKEGYRARSVYKLIQIDEDFDILKGSKRIVDLCGAPGSWSQYVSGSDREVISVDLQNMEPIKGVTILKEDITTVKCVDKIKSIFKGNLADLVLFDGAPDVTGIHSLDEYLQVQLILMALSITLQISEMSSTFIGKIFRGKYTKHLVCHFKKFYKEVSIVKPKASRSSSIESFILAKGLFCKLKKDFELSETEEIEVKSCGSGPDPDLTQENNEEEVFRPTVLPIDPPYLESILNRRNE